MQAIFKAAIYPKAKGKFNPDSKSYRSTLVIFYVWYVQVKFANGPLRLAIVRWSAGHEKHLKLRLNKFISIHL